MNATHLEARRVFFSFLRGAWEREKCIMTHSRETSPQRSPM